MTPPDGRAIGLVVPCTGRGLKGGVLSLVSCYGPVSGAAFDDERGERCSMGSLPCWVLFLFGLLGSGRCDFNAEIGYRGVGEESTLGVHAHTGSQASLFITSQQV